MYSTTRLDLPAISPARPLSDSTARTLRLPRRIDVHRIDAVVAELTETPSVYPLLEVDGSEVEMIDAFGLAALDELAQRTPLAIRNASVALSKTAEYTNHQRLHAACAPLATFPQAA